MSDVNCGLIKFFYPPQNGFVYCRDVCPLLRTDVRNRKFCFDNCPEYIRSKCQYLSTKDYVSSTLSTVLDELTTVSFSDSQADDSKDYYFIIIIGGALILLVAFTVVTFLCFKYKPWRHGRRTNIALLRPADLEVPKCKQDHTDASENDYSRLTNVVVEAEAIKPNPDESTKQSANKPFQAEATKYNAEYGGSSAHGAALYRLLLTGGNENEQGHCNYDLHSTESDGQQPASSQA